MISFLKKILIRQSPIALGLGFAGLLAPTVALYASKGIVILFGVASLVCLGALIVQKGRRLSFPKALGLSVLALTLWGVASLIWTISFDISWTLARSLPFTMLGGFLLILSVRHLNSDGLAFVGRSTVVGYSLGAVLALVDIATGYAISQALNIYKYGGEWNAYMPGFVINNGVTILALFLWPVFIFLWNQGRRGLALVGFVAAVVISSQSSNFAAVIALATGSLAFLLAFFIPRHIYKIAAVGLTLLILGAPFAMRALPDARTVGEDLPELSFSVYPRLVIWQYASNMVMERPIVGHGIRTSRALNKEAEPIWFLLRHEGKVIRGNTKAIPLHPHNGIIQMWLELGGIGAVIGLAVILSVLWGIKKSIAPPITKALLFAALISSICLISVSYGLWQSWWMGALWLQGALIMASQGPRKDPVPEQGHCFFKSSLRKAVPKAPRKKNEIL